MASEPTSPRWWSRPKVWAVALLVGLPLLSLAGRGVVRHPHGQPLHGDGFYYYAYARSLLLDGNLDFTNEYAHYRKVLGTDLLSDGAGFDERRTTPRGLPPNPWAVGMALLLAPFFLLGHAAHLLAGTGTAEELAGYSMSAQLAWLLGSALYGAAGVVLAVDLAARAVRRETAWLCGMAVLLCSALFHYAVVAVWMAHAVSFFAVTLYLWYWDRTREARPLGSWLLLGMLGGLCFTVRWQNALFNVVAAAEWILLSVAAARTDRRRLAWLAGAGAVYVAGMVAGMLPQLLAWKAVYGAWFVFPQAGGAYEVYRYPRFVMETLFSTRNGLVSWTPVVGLALAGFVPLWKRNREVSICLGLAFLLQLWINASVSDYYGGAAFGARKFINCNAIFVLGLALLVDHGPPRLRVRTWAFVFAALAVWNGLFMLQYDLGRIPRGHFLTFYQFVTDKLLLPFELLGKLLG